MSNMTQGSHVSPNLQRRVHGMPSFMSSRLNQECFDSDLYSNTFFNHAGCGEDLTPKTYENSQMLESDDASFYPDDYNWMLSKMNERIPGNETKDALRKLLLVSELADYALYNRNTFIGDPTSKGIPMLNIRKMLNWKQFQDRKHERFMLNQQVMQDRDQDVWSLMNRMKSEVSRSNYTKPIIPKEKPKFKAKMSTRKSEVKSKVKQLAKNGEKKPNCWHFLRGHCKRGKYCDFIHDRRHGYPDSFKVFLGGLPFHITVASLKQELLEQGFNVVNKPKVYGGFSPQVCLASAAEAQRLIAGGSIKIGGMKVDVRCYQAFTKKNQEKLQDVSRRSVFLGGIRKGTTTLMIKNVFESLGLKIMNYPLIKEGFSPQVTMATAEQQLTLVRMVKVEINGSLVDIRPYVGISTQV